MPPKRKTIDEIIGERIRKVRQSEKMSMDALGKKIGVRFSVIHKIEMGTVKMTVHRLIRIAASLDRPIAMFLHGLTHLE